MLKIKEEQWRIQYFVFIRGRGTSKIGFQKGREIPLLSLLFFSEGFHFDH
jgi:hypothetical protein